MKRLYLLRHGTAEAHDSDDAARQLVDRGRQQARQVAALLRRMEVRLDLVLSSPLVRARQTAQELIAHLDRPVELRLDDRLVYATPVATACDALQEVSAADPEGTVCAVGHEPLLSELAAELVGSNLALDLRKGGLIEIEIDVASGPGARCLRGTLLGLLRPAHLR